MQIIINRYQKNKYSWFLSWPFEINIRCISFFLTSTEAIHTYISVIVGALIIRCSHSEIIPRKGKLELII